MKKFSLASVAAVALAGCVATANPDAPTVDMTAEMIDRVGPARIITKVDDGAWRFNLDVEDTLQYALNDEIRQEFELCATGDQPVDVRVTITEFDVDDPSWPAHQIDGVHHIAGTVEFVAASGQVIGRYPVRAILPSRSEMRSLRYEYKASRVAAESFGRAVCLEVFGRNPRLDDPQRNATPN